MRSENGTRTQQDGHEGESETVEISFHFHSAAITDFRQVTAVSHFGWCVFFFSSADVFHAYAAYLLKRPKMLHASVFCVTSKMAGTSAEVARGE